MIVYRKAQEGAKFNPYKFDYLITPKDRSERAQREEDTKGDTNSWTQNNPATWITGTGLNMADQLMRIFNPAMDVFTKPKDLLTQDYWENEFLVPKETQKRRLKYGYDTENPVGDIGNVGWAALDMVGAGKYGKMAMDQLGVYGNKAMNWMKDFKGIPTIPSSKAAKEFKNSLMRKNITEMLGPGWEDVYKGQSLDDVMQEAWKVQGSMDDFLMDSRYQAAADQIDKGQRFSEDLIEHNRAIHEKSAPELKELEARMEANEFQTPEDQLEAYNRHTQLRGELEASSKDLKLASEVTSRYRTRNLPQSFEDTKFLRGKQDEFAEAGRREFSTALEAEDYLKNLSKEDKQLLSEYEAILKRRTDMGHGYVESKFGRSFRDVGLEDPAFNEMNKTFDEGLAFYDDLIKVGEAPDFRNHPGKEISDNTTKARWDTGMLEIQSDFKTPYPDGSYPFAPSESSEWVRSLSESNTIKGPYGEMDPFKSSGGWSLKNAIDKYDMTPPGKNRSGGILRRR